MTEQEAIKNFQGENKILSQYAETKFQKAVFAKKIERNNMAIKALEKQRNNGWIPVDERLPDTNDYILLSFSNFTIPVVGRYETEKDGSGAFYVGDELETCLSQDLFVNAWMQLPEPYKECEKE